MSASSLIPTWNAADPVLPAHIIHEIEKQRREREQPAQIPLYIDDRPPPPGWDKPPQEDTPNRRRDDWGYEFDAN